MRRVIIVSYHFPPYGGKAVQRASKLAKYLPDFGWQPVVFTMPLTESGVMMDRTLLDELPSCVEIHRPRYRDLWKLVPHNIRKYLYNPLPDKYRGWANAVESDLIELINKTGAKALISTSPTHSAQLLGLAAKEKTGIPWIADFRDQWTGHPDFTGRENPEPILEMERSVLKKADIIITAAQCAKRDFQKMVSGGKIRVIENGYDEDDFQLIDRSQPHKHMELRIGYNGTVRPIEDPTTLLETVSDLYNNGAINKDTIQLTFTCNAKGNKIFNPFTGLSKAGILNVKDYIPHPESLARMAEMDISLLLLTKGRDIYPAKVFEYMYLGSPILSLSTPGDDLDRIIRETNSGSVVDYRDHEAIKKAIIGFINLKKQGKLSRISRSREEIIRFSRKHIAERYAEILEKVSGS